MKTRHYCWIWSLKYRNDWITGICKCARTTDLLQFTSFSCNFSEYNHNALPCGHTHANIDIFALINSLYFKTSSILSIWNTSLSLFLYFFLSFFLPLWLFLSLFDYFSLSLWLFLSLSLTISLSLSLSLSHLLLEWRRCHSSYQRTRLRPLDIRPHRQRSQRWRGDFSPIRGGLCASQAPSSRSDGVLTVTCAQARLHLQSESEISNGNCFWQEVHFEIPLDLGSLILDSDSSSLSARWS